MELLQLRAFWYLALDRGKCWMCLAGCLNPIPTTLEQESHIYGDREARRATAFAWRLWNKERSLVPKDITLGLFACSSVPKLLYWLSYRERHVLVYYYFNFMSSSISVVCVLYQSYVHLPSPNASEITERGNLKVLSKNCCSLGRDKISEI